MENIKNFFDKHRKAVIVSLIFLVAFILILSVYLESRKKRLAEMNPAIKGERYPVSWSDTEDGKMRIIADGSETPDYVWKLVSYDGDVITLENEGETDGKISLLIGKKAAGTAKIVLNRVKSGTDYSVAEVKIVVMVSEAYDGSLSMKYGGADVSTRDNISLSDIANIIIEGGQARILFSSNLENIRCTLDNAEVASVSSPVRERVDFEASDDEELKDDQRRDEVILTYYDITALGDGEVTISFYAQGFDVAAEEEQLNNMKNFDVATDDEATKENWEKMNDYSDIIPEKEERIAKYKALMEVYGKDAYATIDYCVKLKVENGIFSFIECKIDETDPESIAAEEEPEWPEDFEPSNTNETITNETEQPENKETGTGDGKEDISKGIDLLELFKSEEETSDE